MQQQANKHRRDIKFKVGEFVWVKLQPYRQTTVAQIRSCVAGILVRSQS